jgi:hypothetical protein
LRQVLLLACLAAASGLADAALVDRYSGQPFRFWLQDGGVYAGTINAIGTNNQVIVRGQGNTARNSVGLINRGALLRGTVNINAVAMGSTAVAIGSGNVARNDIGTIGND